jgi:hypothetical protein
MVVNRTDLQLENLMTGVGYDDAVGSILHIGELSKCAHCMTLYIQVKMSANCNTGVVSLLINIVFTFHGNTTSFITRYTSTLNQAGDSFKNCCTF